jgi:hypothetical protein
MLAKAGWMDAKKYLQNAQEVYEHMKGLKVVIANGGHIGRKICSKAEELVQNSEDEVVPREIRSIQEYVKASIKFVESVQSLRTASNKKQREFEETPSKFLSQTPKPFSTLTPNKLQTPTFDG